MFCSFIVLFFIFILLNLNDYNKFETDKSCFISRVNFCILRFA
ncbi:hypothetical protein CFF8240_0994 [Campylobacter fetus subsp. fetus 82-40]|uniref:Uncharacterized protein n=1 Tax=Campylobacter fetus subsp. fetus (strain 82-40) TaxID=360106 RepID=A0RPM9_CAMFF|nr:hypothetical protein CFF8240_0994 [Campylobacter fetus subsp. fetus 82-40]